MNFRERFFKTINKQNPDRPAVFATFTPQVAEMMSKRLDFAYEEPLDSLLSTRISHADFGSQTCLIMDLDSWRRHFKPRMKRIF